MDRLAEILAKHGLATMSEKPTARDYEQFKVDGLNDAIGDRDKQDGYNCPVCKNKGFVAKLVELGGGSYSHCFADCKCVEVRNSIMRMKRSGLKDIIRDYTFDKFEAVEPWQKTIKAAAMEFAKNPDGWFFLGGQSGAGKTHLCTAICREFLLSGRSVQYMLWRDDVIQLKSAVTDGDEYGKMIDRYKKADVLYIDDMFKTGKAPDGGALKVTGGDINVAFEIINYRYNNPALVTIISSELSEDDLLDIDEATGGRIYERAKAISIGKDRQKNYRIRKAVRL
jgi:DNA replication protein DnaC